MRDLPKYAILTNSETFVGMKVIQLEYPYMIASVFDVNRHHEEKLNEFLEDMAQERYPMAKVDGYTIFLKPYATLEPNDDWDLHGQVLEEMAEYFLNERVLRKPGLFRMSEESGVAERKFDPARQKSIRERRSRVKKD